MGPGCFHPRNKVTGFKKALLAWLQWGRDVSIPEIPQVPPSEGSIGVASMGPGCFHPRNASTARDRRRPKKLQWGRDVSIPEIRSQGRPP